MKKRFLALFLCCVMVFTLLPAALTTAFATGEADGEGTAPAQEIVDVEPEGTGDLDDTQPDPDGQPVDPDAEPVVCTCGAAEGAAHAEDCPLYVNPEQPTGEQDKQDEQPVACTCGAAEGAAHAEDCPLYVNPEQPAGEQDKQDEPPAACTCGAAEDAAHAEDCPLYVAPEQPADEQQPEEEQTDYTEVYEQLMAAETAEELDALLDSFADEAAMDEFLAWLDANDKRTALEEHIAALNEQETLEQEEDTAILPMVVPFTNVGPLLPATVLRRANAPMAVAAKVDDNNNGSNNNSGLVLDKKAESDGNGGYKITMEAYATGASSTTVSTKPADIVLVLDMSGSMDDCLVCGESDTTTHQRYEAVYELDTYKNYYIYNPNSYYNKYSKVEYCNGEHNSNWYNHNGGWVQSNLSNYQHKDNILTPKTSAGDTTQGSVQFYTQITENCTPRINALKSAVSGFINNVGQLSPDSQIAIVKFAGNKTNTVGNNWYNSGRYNHSQIVKNLTAVDAAGKTALQEAVTALRAGGATRADYGMEHAQSIITNSGNNGHNKVVVMFTDGTPTSSSSFEDKVANAAIAASKGIKDKGATVYTIGVFAGADGTPVASLDSVNKTNKYMHLVSSNYKTATELTNPGDATYPEGGKSYYLSAADQGQLENIFQQISQETGGSSVQYGTETVIKDIVTPYFTMPANTTDIKLYTAESNGSANSWKNRESFNGSVAIQVNTVSVSGFSFKDNWCGNHTSSGQTTFHDGKKLIIEFTVSPRAGFLGGNGVPTNGATSGVYHNNQLVGEFPFPTVNVPIEDVTVTAEDKNVYLLGTVTEENCKTDATAKCGGVDLDLNAANYGLASWKTEFVEITTTVTPQGSPNLTADGTYTISVKVAPEPLKPGIVPPTGTPATAQTKSATANINVFKPELTFKDTEAYYGAAVPTNFDSNLTATVWKHKGTVANPATMLGTEPELNITCTPDASKIDANGKINTTDDIGVAVTVKIGDRDVTGYTKFHHQECIPNQNCTLPANSEFHFLIHVKTCTLTITKKVTDTAIDDGQSFIFNVTGPGIAKTVVIQGKGSVILKGLKVGEYKVIEDTTWSWRYRTDNGTQSATLSANSDNEEVIVTNTLKNEKWVSTDVYCKNEFKGKGIQTIINGSGKTVNGKPTTN